ncbi:MAG: hypothetical protein QW266_06045 [Sulfolobales archaeon]
MVRTMSYINEPYAVLREDSQHRPLDLEYLDGVISGIVFINSMLSVVNSLGYYKHSEELVEILKEYVGELVEALSIEGTYVPGFASLLATKVRKSLWELDTPDSALMEFLNMLVGYRIELTRGNLGVEDSKELLKSVCYYLHITSCEEIEQYLHPLTPPLALQAALTSLAISVGGIGV